MAQAAIIFPTIRAVPATATIIFLHGLGDTGRGWLPIASMLKDKVPHAKWILPTAPMAQVSLAQGMPMNSWFDITSLSMDGVEDEAGIKTAAKNLEGLIEAEIASGTPSERIVIGGFSQGGSTALYTSLSTKFNLAGTIALSTWLPLRTTITSISEQAKKGRYFHAHGEDDEVVRYEFGKGTVLALNKLGIPAEADAEGRGITFKTYDDMGHSADDRELVDLAAWLKKAIP